VSWDAFLPNALTFACGQLVAWGYLRTGLVRRGIALMLTIWVLADVALLARFAYEQQGLAYVLPLLGMQLCCVAGTAWFAFCRLRRRYSGTARRAGALFAAGQQHYFRGEFDRALAAFQKLHRNDPWNVPAAISLAAVLARRGRARQAVRLYRQARALDLKQEYQDFIENQLERVAGRSGSG
jgi:tetratricopeptide (TPR) repeat protein